MLQIKEMTDEPTLANASALILMMEELPLYNTSLQGGCSDELEASLLDSCRKQGAKMVDCAAGFTSSSDAVPGADDALFEKYMQVVKVATENCVRCEDLERLAKQLRERDYARKNEQRKSKLKDVLTEMDVANVQEVDKISNTLSTTKLDGGVDADVRTVALGIWTKVLALPCLSEFFTPTFKTYTIFLKRLVGYLPEVASDEYNHASRMLCAMQALGDASQALRALGHTPTIIAQHAGVHDVVKRVDREILKATPLNKKPTPSCQKKQRCLLGVPRQRSFATKGGCARSYRWAENGCGGRCCGAWRQH
jgi:hypothetical protein